MGRGQVNEDYSQLIAIQDDVQIEPESVQGVAEISDVRNEKAIEVSAGLGNISFSRQADAHQDQELQNPASQPKQHLDGRQEAASLAKQEPIGYRTEPSGPQAQQQLNPSTMQLMQGPRRNIDVIR